MLLLKGGFTGASAAARPSATTTTTTTTTTPFARRHVCRAEADGKGGEKESTSKTLSNLDSLLGVPPPPPKEDKPAAPDSSSSSSQPSQQAGIFNTWPANPSAPKPPPAAAKKKAGEVTFEQIMAFEGLAPEVINGRAAMIGFFAAISAETGTGESVYAQLLTGGLGKAALVILAVTLASFAPAIVSKVPMAECFNKEPKKEKSLGPFVPNAELQNGRAAMIGLALILLLEGGSGTAFFI